jgi:5-methylcytosine-specific restriction enzyme subunit McrC
MLLYAWNEPPTFKGAVADAIEKAPTLDGLLCLVLIELVQQRFRIGLGRSYIDERNIIRGIRGKINFGESLKRSLFNQGRASCEYQQFSLNVPKNQIIRSTMLRMIKSGQFGPDRAFETQIRQRLRMLCSSMDGVDFVELSQDLIHRQQLGRNDRDYRIMLAICELLLLRYIPSDTTGHMNLLEIEREKLRLFNVFERFVANFYKYHLSDWKVTSQKILNWHEEPVNKYLPIMQPDLFIKHKHTNRIIILDTKFTPQTARSRHGRETLHSTHLYQLYAYLRTQSHISDSFQSAEGILLYPVSKSQKLSEKFKVQDQTIRIESVDLTMDWEAIEGRLIKIIDT